MDVTDVLRRLLRLRWAVAAVLVVALLAALIGYSSAGSSRQSRAAVVIVPPKVANVTGGDNPLLNLDNNLAQLAVVLSAALGSETVADALAKDGGTADFDVSTVTGDNPSFSQLSPQLVFTVTGSSDAVTMRTADALIEQSRSALNQLQQRAGVPASSRASVVEVTPPTPPITVSGGRLRSAGALGVGIVVLGLVLVLAVDALRRRRATVPAVAPAPVPAVPTSAPSEPPPATVVDKAGTAAPDEEAAQPAEAQPPATADATGPPATTAPPMKRALRTTPPVKKTARKTATASEQTEPAKPARKAPAKKGLGAPKTPPVKKTTTPRAVQRDLFASLRAGDDVLPPAKAELLPDPPVEAVAPDPELPAELLPEPAEPEPKPQPEPEPEPEPEPAEPEPAVEPTIDIAVDTAVADESAADTTETMVMGWSSVSLNGAATTRDEPETPDDPATPDLTDSPANTDGPADTDSATGEPAEPTPPARKTARRSPAAGAGNRRTGTPSRRARARKAQG